jgi:hypothetical protein
VFVALVEEINCEDKAEWRRGSGARALSIADLRRLQEPFHMVIRSGSAGLGVWIVGDGISPNVRSITCVWISSRGISVCLQPVLPARLFAAQLEGALACAGAFGKLSVSDRIAQPRNPQPAPYRSP